MDGYEDNGESLLNEENVLGDDEGEDGGEGDDNDDDNEDVVEGDEGDEGGVENWERGG